MSLSPESPDFTLCALGSWVDAEPEGWGVRERDGEQGRAFTELSSLQNGETVRLRHRALKPLAHSHRARKELSWDLNLGPCDLELPDPWPHCQLPQPPEHGAWSFLRASCSAPHLLSLNPMWPPSAAQPWVTCHLLLGKPKQQPGPAIPSLHCSPSRAWL